MCERRDTVGRGTLLGKCALVFLPSERGLGIQRLEILRLLFCLRSFSIDGENQVMPVWDCLCRPLAQNPGAQFQAFWSQSIARKAVLRGFTRSCKICSISFIHTHWRESFTCIWPNTYYCHFTFPRRVLRWSLTFCVLSRHHPHLHTLCHVSGKSVCQKTLIALCENIKLR